MDSSFLFVEGTLIELTGQFKLQLSEFKVPGVRAGSQFQFSPK